MNLSGDGAKLTLGDGSVVEVRFTYRNLARIEENFGGHDEWIDGLIHRPYATVATTLAVFNGEALEKVYAALEGANIDEARKALNDAYIASVPWQQAKKEQDGAGEADPPPAVSESR